MEKYPEIQEYYFIKNDMKNWRTNIIELIFQSESKVDFISKLSIITIPNNDNTRYLQALPSSYRTKGRTIISKLQKYLKVDDDGNTIFLDGSVGSGFLLYLEYYLGLSIDKPRYTNKIPDIHAPSVWI
jgi:hypothetical protein